MRIVQWVEWRVVRWRSERAERRRLVEQQRVELAAAFRREQLSPRCGAAHPELRGVYCQEPLGHEGVLHIDRSRGRGPIAWQASGYDR